ncbi:MAG: hypothetical protein UT33_C0012G0072 [Candidatus Peregrinibacteria bacterium GW2011_GWC2_39_14]|nr:MAG: hypothetical protein US92_C0003G0099 [Candidatus Peregrinibacteria bacterium GW2011_GWA2_38_36]KKR05267.1 MAG: hypothetical protein UT33_C0012G0072 [Candidatus Peregrinibacteria bacterium GW2011_GWC2_39_14]
MTVNPEAYQSELDDTVHVIEIRGEAGNGAGQLKKALLGFASLFTSRAKTAVGDLEEVRDAPIIAPLTDGEKKRLKMLFPDGFENSNSKQRNVGNCYYLAAWRNVKKHQLGAKVIASMLARVERAGWDVEFPNGRNFLIGDNEELGYQMVPDERGIERKRKSVDGQRGDVIMERAFGRLRKAERNVGGEAGQMHTMAIIVGGFCSEVFKAFFDDIAKEIIDIGSYQPLAKTPVIYRYKDRALNAFKEQAAHPSNFIFTAITPNVKTPYSIENTNRENEFDDKFLYYMDPEKRFPCRHAYSIESVDLRSETLVIVNPWNTGRLKYRITFDKFFEYFSKLEGVEFDEQKVIKKFPEVVFQGDSIDVDEPQELKPGLRYSIRGLGYTVVRFSGELGPTVMARINSDDELELESSARTKHRIKKGEWFIISKEFMAGHRRVSINHARIKYLGDGEVEIRDNNSTNGTAIIDIKHVDGYVPSKRLMPGQEEIYEMHNKDIEIVLADTVTLLCVRREGKILVFQKGRVAPIAEMIPGDMRIIGCKEVLDLKKRVSRVHIELRNLNGHLSVRDVMSKGGTVTRKVNEREEAIASAPDSEPE